MHAQDFLLLNYQRRKCGCLLVQTYLFENKNHLENTTVTWPLRSHAHFRACMETTSSKILLDSHQHV